MPEPRSRRRPTAWMPAAVFLGVSAVFAAFWWIANRQETWSTQVKTAMALEQAARGLEEYLGTRIDIVEQLGGLWRRVSGPEEASFRASAESSIASFEGIVALNWVDSDGVIRWVVPEEPNRAALGRDLDLNPTAAPVLAAARDDDALKVTPPLDLYQGGFGFAVYRPVVRDGRLLGFVNGAFRIAPLIDGGPLSEVREHYQYSVTDNGHPVAEHADDAQRRGRRFERSLGLPVGDRVWTLTLWPTDATVAEDAQLADEALLALGLLVAAGLALAFFHLGRSRAMLSDSERRYRTLVEDNPAMICRFLPDTTLTFVNRGYATYFGQEPDALVGRRFLEFVPESEHGRILNRIAGLTPDSPTTRYVHPACRPDGATAWQEWTDRALFDEHGAAVEYQSIGFDITERQTAREELERSETRFRTIFDAVGEGILVLDTDGRLIDANARAVGLFGAEHDRMIGLKVEELGGDDGAASARLATAVERVAGTGRELRIPGWVATRGSTEWYADVTLRRAAIGGENRVLAVVDDVTERARLEEQLRHSQKMEAMGTLAAGVAHDFNNALTAILGHTERARQEVDPVSPAGRALAGVVSACEQASGVVRSLLTFGRRAPGRRVHVDAAGWVRESLGLLRPLLPDSILVETEIPGDGVLWVVGDRMLLQQVLINLVLNGRDAMDHGGRITITLREERFQDPHTGETDRRVVLQVADTGEGMTEDVRSRVLEPFFTTKPRERGTGLGMSVVHGIVAAHEGDLDVASRPGRGTCVTVRLPAASPPPVEAERASGEDRAADLTHRTVLVVEDNAQVRGLIVSALDRAGMHGREAGDGVEALEAWSAAELRFDAMVVDLDLPRMRGDEFVRRVRASGDRAPILVISGNPEVGHDIADDPSVRFLAKPFRMDDVVREVAGLLEREA